MNALLNNTLGVIAESEYRVEVLLDDKPPKKSISGVGKRYVYITKYHHGGLVCERSIGLPVDKAIELGRILLLACKIA